MFVRPEIDPALSASPGIVNPAEQSAVDHPNPTQIEKQRRRDEAQRRFEEEGERLRHEESRRRELEVERFHDKEAQRRLEVLERILEEERNLRRSGLESARTAEDRGEATSALTEFVGERASKAAGVSERENSQTHPEFNVDRLREKLPWGNIAFDKPPKMILDETKEFQLALSPTKTLEELKQHLQEQVNVETRKVQVSEYMEASLSGDGFNIVSPIQKQLVSKDGVTEWHWDVTAKKPGKQRLHLVLYAIVNYDGNDRPLTIKTYREVIDVDVTLYQQTAMILGSIGNHMEWLWPGLIIPIVAWIWRSKRIKGAETKEVVSDTVSSSGLEREASINPDAPEDSATSEAEKGTPIRAGDIAIKDKQHKHEGMPSPIDGAK